MDRADLTLSAGPNDVSARVKAGLAAPIDYHYDPVFAERFRESGEARVELGAIRRRDQRAVFGAAAGFLWEAVCTKQFGGTPMKLALGMRVVQAETGAPVTEAGLPRALRDLGTPVLSRHKE